MRGHRAKIFCTQKINVCCVELFPREDEGTHCRMRKCGPQILSHLPRVTQMRQVVARKHRVPSFWNTGQHPPHQGHEALAHLLSSQSPLGSSGQSPDSFGVERLNTLRHSTLVDSRTGRTARHWEQVAFIIPGVYEARPGACHQLTQVLSHSFPHSPLLLLLPRSLP